MTILPEDVRLFIKDITLFIQRHENCNSKKLEPMFQKAYKLYTKYDVENEPPDAADVEQIAQEIHEQCSGGASVSDVIALLQRR